MNYFNLKTSQMRTPEFRESSAAGRGTWLVLVTHCVEQENGGRIPDCRRWTNRLWLQICGVELAEIEECTFLLQWDGDDLIVKFYPLEMEDAMRVARVNGRAGGLKSAEVRRTASAMDPLARETNVPESTPAKSLVPPATLSGGGQGGLEAPLAGSLKEGCNEKETKDKGNEMGNGKATEEEGESAAPRGAAMPESVPVSDEPPPLRSREEEWRQGSMNSGKAIPARTPGPGL